MQVLNGGESELWGSPNLSTGLIFDPLDNIGMNLINLLI